jgi:hypothetical protein
LRLRPRTTFWARRADSCASARIELSAVTTRFTRYGDRARPVACPGAGTPSRSLLRNSVTIDVVSFESFTLPRYGTMWPLRRIRCWSIVVCSRLFASPVLSQCSPACFTVMLLLSGVCRPSRTSTATVAW